MSAIAPVPEYPKRDRNRKPLRGRSLPIVSGVENLDCVESKILLKAGLHRFPCGTFGTMKGLVRTTNVHERDTLMIACSEQGTAPDNVSFAKPDQFVVLQHIAASMPSAADCERCEGLCIDDVESLFDKYNFRHVIVCGHLGCGVIRYWLRPTPEGHTDIGEFRRRFDQGTRNLVDKNYSPSSSSERHTLMICEHVLVQIANMITHPFILERILDERTSFHGWVVDDGTSRVYGYSPEESAFLQL